MVVRRGEGKVVAEGSRECERGKTHGGCWVGTAAARPVRVCPALAATCTAVAVAQAEPRATSVTSTRVAVALVTKTLGVKIVMWRHYDMLQQRECTAACINTRLQLLPVAAATFGENLRN